MIISYIFNLFLFTMILNFIFLFFLQKYFHIGLESFFVFFLFFLQKDFDIFHMLLFEAFLCVSDKIHFNFKKCFLILFMKIFFIRNFFITIFFIGSFFIRIFFIRIFSLRIRKKFYIVNNVLRSLFFFITTYLHFS